MAGWYTKNLAEHYAKDPAKLEAVLYGNALKLFPKWQKIFAKKL